MPSIPPPPTTGPYSPVSLSSLGQPVSLGQAATLAQPTHISYGMPAAGVYSYDNPPPASPFEGAAEDTDPEYDYHLIKKTFMKPKSHWTSKLDKYRKHGFTKDTPIKSRICVVSGLSAGGIPDDGSLASALLKEEAWVWMADCFWMVASYHRQFLDAMAIPNGRSSYFPVDELWNLLENRDGLDWVAGRYHIDDLDTRELVKLDGSAHTQSYTHKHNTVRFYRNEDFDEALTVVSSAPNRYCTKPKAEMALARCEVIGLFFPTPQTIKYRKTYDEASTSFSWVSAAAYNKGKAPNVTVCQACGKHFDSSLIVINDVDTPETHPSSGKKICKRCYEHRQESVVIRGWDDSNFLPAMPDHESLHRKAAGKFHVKSLAVRRMFGVEIELGFNQGSRVQQALDVWNTLGKDFCYIKHDGSITKLEIGGSKYGFEIVSAPAGINVHRERWKKIGDIKDFDKKSGKFKTFRSWDLPTCGFHVHVSRDSLTQFQIGRILVFVNHTNNRYFIDVVAGRGEGYYNKFIHKEFTDCEIQDETKYTAVRTNKKHTIEFRIFRGTINYRHIIRNIEFVDAVCDFTNPGAASLRDMADYRKFIEFVDARRHHYPMFSAWMQTIEIIAKKKMPKDDKFFKEIPIDEAVNPKVADQLKSILSGKMPNSGLADEAPTASDDTWA